MDIEQQYRDRVRFGISQLNAVWEGWRSHINVEALNIGGDFSCVGGQIIRAENPDRENISYFDFANEFQSRLGICDNETAGSFMDACGIYVVNQSELGLLGIDYEFDNLTRVWKEELEALPV